MWMHKPPPRLRSLEYALALSDGAAGVAAHGRLQRRRRRKLGKVAAVAAHEVDELHALSHRPVRLQTCIMIAHRLSTVVDADRILVLRAGRVAESGTHSELIAREGEYAQLWRIQAAAGQGP